MAKIRIDKLTLSPNMSERDMIFALERWVVLLVRNFEHILTNISEENLNGAFLSRLISTETELARLATLIEGDGTEQDNGGES